LQGALRGRDAAAHDRADLVDGIAEHVSQDHGASLRHREAHEGPEARSHDLAVGHGAGQGGDHVQIFIGVGSVVARAPAQEIECRIVSDPKQPPFRIVQRFGPRGGLDRLEECLLKHVLAVDDRARHARAIAVQLRSQLHRKAVDGLPSGLLDRPCAIVRETVWQDWPPRHRCA
jgi:hypothetical protein